VGVLFVHGIGEQHRGDTVLAFGEPLYRWLCDWLTSGDRRKIPRELQLSKTNLNRPIGSGYTPAATHLRIIAPGPDNASQTIEWLMAESWWAEDFKPPSFGQLAKWGFGVGPWIIQRQVNHLIDRSQQAGQAVAKNQPKKTTNPLLKTVVDRTTDLAPTSTSATRPSLAALPIRLITFIYLLIRAVLQLIASFAVTFLAQLLILCLLLLAWIPPLRRLLEGVQRALSNSIGDSYILVTSPFRFNAMMSQVQLDLYWLSQQGCDKIAVIAHSQGAAVAYEALKHDPSLPVDLFVTFGSGLSKLKAIQKILPNEGRIKWGSGLSFIGMACVLIGSLSILSSLLQINLPFVSDWSTLLSGLFVLGAALVFVVSRLILQGRVSPLTEEELLIRDPRAQPGMIWQDYYASSDPVPDGPLPQIIAGVQSSTIYNQASWLRDHSLYWANREQFVARIACQLAQLAGWQWSDTDLQIINDTADRRATRVTGIMLARSVCLVSLLITSSTNVNPWLRPIGAWLQARIGFLAAVLPEWLFQLVQQLSGNGTVWLGRAVVLLVILIWYRLIKMAWNWWDNAEALRMFQRASVANECKPRAAIPFFLAATALPLLGCALWFGYAWSQANAVSLVLAAASVLTILIGVWYGWRGLCVPVQADT
jgi:pimeloyl-ACP methyl ester carboxylesterase